MKKTVHLYCIVMAALCLFVRAQSLTELQANYSGDTTWDSETGALTFTSSGTVYFEDKIGDGADNRTDQMQNFWDVPKSVHKIVIQAGVTVTGAFHTFDDCIIEGEDRSTSVIYGTPLERWADQNNPGGQDLDEWYYAQCQNFGGVLTVRNLTLLNPFSYFIRGWNQVNHAVHCDFIDNRGGHGNHSDGFSGGHGSTVDQCYFETGDDAIKCYFDITVTNTTIKMIDNCVPFQFGWGTYQDSRSHLENIRITGSSGRTGSGNPVFQWVRGSDKKTVTVTGIDVSNSNASLFDLQTSTGTLNMDVSNAHIVVENYQYRFSTGGTVTICGGTQKKSVYSCVEAPQVSFSSIDQREVISAGDDVVVRVDAFDFHNEVETVALYLDDQLIAEDHESPYQWNESGQYDVLNDMSAGQYVLKAEAASDQGLSRADSVDLIVSEGVPDPWHAADIGSPKIPGYTEWSDDQFMVNTGARTLYGSADECHFVYQRVTGDQTIICKVASFDFPDDYALAGVMMRESLDPGSKHASALIQGGKKYSFRKRKETDGYTLRASQTLEGDPVYPRWLKLSRNGHWFKASVSEDGQTWTPSDSIEIVMTDSVYIGLAVTSNSETGVALATLSEVLVGESTVGVNETSLASPAVFRLYPNYPNPFNPRTVIRYDLPCMCHVRLTIYNIQGQLIATPRDGKQVAGSYVETFAASNLTSGVYVYRIQATGSNHRFTEIKKMMILK